MPIEIKELIVRATIDPEGPKGSTGASGRKKEKSSDEIVAECVEQVMEILRKERDR